MSITSKLYEALGDVVDNTTTPGVGGEHHFICVDEYKDLWVMITHSMSPDKRSRLGARAVEDFICLGDNTALIDGHHLVYADIRDYIPNIDLNMGGSFDLSQFRKPDEKAIKWNCKDSRLSKLLAQWVITGYKFTHEYLAPNGLPVSVYTKEAYKIWWERNQYKFKEIKYFTKVNISDGGIELIFDKNNSESKDSTIVLETRQKVGDYIQSYHYGLINPGEGRSSIFSFIIGKKK